MEKIKTLATADEIKAFSDPYRLQILYTFKKMGRPATVKQIGDAMGEVPAKVHYHVKKMEKSGVLRLTHTEEINGIIAKYYEPAAESFAIKSEELDPDVSKLVVNEAQKVISSVYDESKKVILEELKTAAHRPKRVTAESIRLSMIYLTDEKARELDKYIEEFLHEYGKKTPKANEDTAFRKYHVFTVMMPVSNNDVCGDK